MKLGAFFDPLGQPKVTAGRDNCFRTCCPSVRSYILFKSRKTKQQNTIFATGVTMGLAEWIIDDTSLVTNLKCTLKNNFQSCLSAVIALYYQSVERQANLIPKNF